MTALHYHACSGNVAVLSFLLASGAAVDAMDYRGATALHWAIFQRLGYTALVLLAGGANPSAQDTTGQSPLMLAVLKQEGELIKLLMTSGAEVHPVKDVNGATATTLAKVTT